MSEGEQQRGAFIVFEGLDRSGKSTQSEMLVKHLKSQGSKVEHLRFPNRDGPLGKLIDQYLKKEATFTSHTCHFLFSGNRWEAQADMKKLLKEGTHIVADRYAFSGLAYSHGAEGLDKTWVMTADSGLLCPDAVFYVAVAPETAAKRGAYGEERYEKLTTQQNVQKVFKEAFEGMPYWETVNGERPIDEVFDEIKKRADEVISKAKTKAMTALWDGGKLND